MVDAIRKQLDALMGANRNKDTCETMHYWDDSVCKYGLLGCCVHKLWYNTKADPGPCPYICGDDKLQAEFKADTSAKKKQFERKWKNDLRLFLRKKVNDCDSRIRVAKEKLLLRQSQNETALNQLPEFQEVTSQIAAVNKELEAVSEQGDIDRVQVLVQELEILKLRKTEIQSRLGYNTDMDMHVCEVTGAYISDRDPEDRRTNFLNGKLYQGWLHVRNKYNELNEFFKRTGPWRGDDQLTRVDIELERERRDPYASFEESRDNNNTRSSSSSNKDESKEDEEERQRQRERERLREEEREKERERERARDRILAASI